MTGRIARLALATAAGLACLFINDNWSSTEQSSLITQADARIGQPLTPGSVAGVNRRASRRAYRRGYHGTGEGVAVGAAVVAGGAATAAYVGAPAAPYPDYAPSFVHDAVPVEPGYSATVTDPATGRTCTISPSGYHWCWKP